MHRWGDGFKYFSEVGEAAYFIGKYCRKYGRISVTQTKEKYGTARVYCSFGINDFHNLTHPGYHFNQYPKWLWNLNLSISYSKLGQLFFRLLNKIIVPYQIWIYRKAYYLAFKKWPLIKKEIISGADYAEFVSPYFEPVTLCSTHSIQHNQGTIRLDWENCLVCKEKNETQASE